MPVGADTTTAAGIAQSQQRGWDIFLHLFPTSVIDAMARGDILQVVVFRPFSASRSRRSGPKGQPVLDVLESTAQAMFRFTSYVMVLAPLGVFAAMASTVGGKGLGILFTLGKLVGLMYVGLAHLRAHRARRRVGDHSRAVLHLCPRDSRAVSDRVHHGELEAALPKAHGGHGALRRAQNIVAFVLPTGYSFNLDGSTLYLSLASVFVAQIAGVSMTLGQQLMMMLTLMLTSKGVAGVPRASLVVLAATLSQFGLPLEGAAILLGIDQIMDMGRTAVNVMGNCIATAVVARWEGVLDDQQMRISRSIVRPGWHDVSVAVVGARGQLGAAIVHEFTAARYDVMPFSRQALDITDDDAVDRGDRRARPDVIINCTAYNEVDAAEDLRSTRSISTHLPCARSRAGRAGRGDVRSLRQRFRVRRHATRP